MGYGDFGIGVGVVFFGEYVEVVGVECGGGYCRDFWVVVVDVVG